MRDDDIRHVSYSCGICKDAYEEIRYVNGKATSEAKFKLVTSIYGNERICPKCWSRLKAIQLEIQKEINEESKKK